MISAAAEGYYFPEEWRKHEAVFLSWPYDIISFPNLKNVERTYISIIKALQETKSEEVNLFVTDNDMKSRVEKMIRQANLDLSKVHFFVFDYGDVWFRDYGPTFLINRKSKSLAMVKWIFNAWGNKYPELLKDDLVAESIAERMKIRCFKAGLVMEGGSLEVNGKGTLLTTEQCLLNKNRNPGLKKAEIENILKQSLGVENIIWLREGLQGDDTDGHIDNLARFVDENTILCAYEDDEKDVNHKSTKENYEILLKAKNQDGKKFHVVKLPVPKLYSHENKRLPASYANFYIANNAVLVPQFNLPTDLEAMKIISRYFPKRKKIGIDCEDLVYGFGTLHCISQQLPEP